MTDNVNHPSHYQQYKGVEVIDLTEQMNFNRGNAVKYICRAGFKDAGNLEKEIEDLAKAAFYINREIERLKEVAIDIHAIWDEEEVELYIHRKHGNVIKAFQFTGRNAQQVYTAYGIESKPEEGHQEALTLKAPREGTIKRGCWIIVGFLNADTFSVTDKFFTENYQMRTKK